jgi:ubiquinone/menaquinone biosynthesis C-methylase UbiE
VQLSVCVEETTLPIQTVFPDSICTNLDLFDDSTMTEPAIIRAKNAAESSALVRAKPAALPLDDDSSELTVLTLAAHEIREPALRRSLFAELARITTSHGRVIVAEHLRNLPAALAFGPGLFHFYPHSEWAAGFRIESEFNITPFIHIFVLEHE